MALFLAGLGLVDLLRKVGHGFWLEHSQFWVYPLQTLICGWVLLHFRRDYARREGAARAGWWVGLLAGLLVFVIWIAPQAFLGWPPRTEGFNPQVFADRPALYWFTVVFRFLRLAVVVPFLEEIFWRGFLLRILIKEDFDSVPFGAFTWMSFLAVAIAFAFSHSRPDWAAAFITGLLYNAVAVWTKSLSSCVLAHAVTNLLLGLWIMKTAQWGFW